MSNALITRRVGFFLFSVFCVRILKAAIVTSFPPVLENSPRTFQFKHHWWRVERMAVALRGDCALLRSTLGDDEFRNATSM